MNQNKRSFNDLAVKYVNREEKERVLGRYHSSEIFSILKGYLTPQDFFKPRPKDLTAAKRILVGIAMENQLTDIFKETGIEFKTQQKKEQTIATEQGDITLVAQLDYEFNGWILETKFSFGGKIENYYPQLCCYEKIFNKPVKLGILSVPFNLKIIDYKADDKLWSAIINKLKSFHEEVKLCQQ